MGDYMDDMKYEDMTPSAEWSDGFRRGKKNKEQAVDAAYNSGYNDGYQDAVRELSE